MKDTELRLTLRRSDGKPISGARVRVDMIMPRMEMPENHFDALADGPGVYSARTIFTMPGEWRIRIEAVRPGSSDVFDFETSVR